ncbi:MAG: PDZ domain-containing protein [Sciscionella sp.]|nr:PDZ domain-containing protein [Sciscionella sp.]
MVVSFGLVIVLGLIGALVKVPYVAIGPGPTTNTLGKVGNTDVVSIDGTQVHQPNGQLRMTTVSLTDSVTLFGALGLWLSGSEALAPREEYYQPGQTDQQVEQQNVEQFQQSQSSAEISALRYLHYPMRALAKDVTVGGPSDKIIKPGDQFIDVNGTTINDELDVRSALTHTTPGQTVPVTLRTGNDAPRTVHIKLGKNTQDTSQKQGFLGITTTDKAQVPFTIKINVPDVGGPSAGLMFALTIIDKLTDDDLAGGKTVAGTGEIDEVGDVAPIGGIPFKLIAARDAGATVFLVPADNCAEAKSKVPAGLQLVKVASLDAAVHDLQDLKAGKQVPSC